MAPAIPFIMMAVAAAGSIMSSQAQAAAAKRQAQAQEYSAAVDRNNAILAQANADNALKVASVQEDEKRRSNAMQLGAQRSALIESGIDTTSGSGADLVNQSAINNELDALNIRYGGQIKANSYLNQSNSALAQADLDTMAANNSRANARAATGPAMYIGAASSALSAYSGSRYTGRA